MRLQNLRTSNPELLLQYNGKTVESDELHITNAVVAATDEIAGNGKGISNKPLTLVVRKRGVPDLTMVDLPGITRVPVHGQPDDIYEQISGIIMEYITPEESIILNVLSASVDFTTCESIRMSQRVDKTGERTLAVVTKADRAPEGLLEKVTTDDVNIGLGYICVRNRIADETYEKARDEETKLYKNHPLLSKINKSMVGVTVLAQKLVQIQAAIIAKSLPSIVEKIDDKLSSSIDNVKKLPQNMTSVAHAMTAFMQIIGSAKESLRKLFLRGEFDEYPDERNMHCTARLAEMLTKFSEKMQAKEVVDNSNTPFLSDEISYLEESKSIELPNFLPRAAFREMLHKKVKGISDIPLEFVDMTWTYVGNVVISVLMKHAENYPQLIYSTRCAAQNLVAKKKQQLMGTVKDMIEMENSCDYTCNPEYLKLCTSLMSCQGELMEIVQDQRKKTKLAIEGYGEVEVGHLRGSGGSVQGAFELKMRLVAYWKIVVKRIVDNMALHLLFGVQNLVNKEFEEIIGEVIGKDGRRMEGMLGETPAVADKRRKLLSSIELLKESKDVVSNIIMDRISTETQIGLLPSFAPMDF